MKLILDILHGDNELNKFMHASDMFEPGKQLAEYECMSCTYTKTIEELPDLISKIRHALIDGGENVVFLSIKKIDGKVNTTIAPYIKEDVQAISDGKKFGLFKEFLEELGHSVTTTEWKARFNSYFKIKS